MRATVIGFVLLQIVVWSIVFSGEDNLTGNFYEDLSDTWEVMNVNQKAQGDVLLHYPTFNRLTLNSDGNFIRFIIDGTPDGSIEEGKWRINKENTHLILDTGFKLEKYEIIQMPDQLSNVFIIKGQANSNTEKPSKEVKLTRL